MKIKESGCIFELYSNSKYIDIEKLIEEYKLNGLLKSVEGILLNGNSCYFIEVKRYDYFAKNDSVDENLNKVLLKLINSYFFAQVELKKSIKNINMVIYICEGINYSLTIDRKVVIKDMLQTKIKKKIEKLKNLSIKIDFLDNKYKIFRFIKEDR